MTDAINYLNQYQAQQPNMLDSYDDTQGMPRQRPADPLRWLADYVGQNKDLPAPQFFMDPRSLSARNMLHSALNTSANWLDATKDPSLIGPAEVVSPLGALPMVGVASRAPTAMTRPAMSTQMSQHVADNARGQPPNIQAAGRRAEPNAPVRERTPEEREAIFREWQNEAAAIRRGKSEMTGGRIDDAAISRLPSDPRYKDFDEFITGNRRDAWVTVDGDLSIHARRAPGGIVLTNMEAAKPGGGKFSSFLDRYEPVLNLQVENIYNHRLPDYLKRRGFALYGDGGIPQAVRQSGTLLADNAKGSAPGTVVNSVAEPQTIRAYHGSPHDFDKFSMDKIGTGEGSQAFGYGLYFAENPKTADAYRPRSWNPFAKRPGKSYEVDIRAKPDEFIDLDIPLSSQPKSIQDTIARVADEQMTRKGWPESHKQYMRDEISADGTTQDSLSRLYGTFYRDTETPGAWEADAAKALKDAGIKGTRFFDSGSRDKKQGTRNYVVFDDSLIDINRKYARNDVASTPGLAANSTQPQDDSAVTDILRRYGLAE